MKPIRSLCVLAVVGQLLAASPVLARAPRQQPTLVLEAPEVVLTGIPFDVVVRAEEGPIGPQDAAALRVVLDDDSFELVSQDDGTLLAEGLAAASSGVVALRLLDGGATVSEAETRAVPGWLSVLPPLLAIVIALAFRSVIPALFLGVWVGAWAAAGLTTTGLFGALLEAFHRYVRDALADPDNAAIILFSLMIGGMVGIVSRNGGMQGVVNIIVRWASDARRGQTATGALGCVIFFDDYANTLVVGNTMRQVTDRLRISREKLAYIVDSTAAPVSCIALVTTWIGYEVGLVAAAVAGTPGYDESAYSIFLNSIPYSFYPLLAIFFVFVVASTGRDFGPMFKAELRARTTGEVLGPGASVDEAAVGARELEPKEGKPQRALNALLPVGVLVGTVLVALYVTGEGDSLRDIVGSADAPMGLMWASLLGALVAALLSIGQRILTLEETVEAWYAGLRSMMLAMIILILAWSLSDVTDVLHTADYLTSVLGETLPAAVVPAIVFVLSAATAFATGTSWGTMGILLPLVVPLVWAVLQANGMADPEHWHIIYSTIACVLSGAVWGDHCSPISDTTILSSMASGCDHIEHVRTQLPYALSVGSVGLVLGTLPAGFGVPWWIGLAAGAAVLWAWSRYLGDPVDVVVDQIESGTDDGA